MRRPRDWFWATLFDIAMAGVLLASLFAAMERWG